MCAKINAKVIKRIRISKFFEKKNVFMQFFSLKNSNFALK